MNFDYGIIGGGPAGYTASIMLAQKGFKVLLFEKDKLGGTCLNRGCIPTKSILHSSELYKQILLSNRLGVELEIKSFDFKKIIEKSELTISKIRKNLELAVKNSGVTIVNAEAKIVDSKTIYADKEYKVDNIIVATGSKSKEIESLQFDSKFILNSDDILKIDSLPKSVLILGSGAIGIEWARIFSNFGVEVSVLELADHLLPIADIDVSKRIERLFKQNKIKYYLKDSISSINNGVVTLKSGNTVHPDFILVAVGRTPVKPEKINDARIIGDACGGIQLAHTAIYQALNLLEYEKGNLCKNLVPFVIYGEPEIAWVGVKEQECDESCRKVTLPITVLGKSWTDDSTDGFIKIIEKNDQIIGAHIISKEASALIQQVLIAMQNKISINELKKVSFAHPTFSEGIQEALYRF